MSSAVGADPALGRVQARASLAGALWSQVMASERWRPWAIILGWKALSFALILLAVLVIPTSEASREGNFAYPEDGGALTRAFSTWDSSHYLFLADQGYARGQPSDGFAPLYPMAVGALKEVIGGNGVLAGLIVANLASGLGLWAFYTLVRRRFDSRVATRALLLLIAFPTAFFLNLIYTEGLFLLLAAGFFLCLHERRYPLAAALAFLLPLTRFVGVLVVVPFALHFALGIVESRRAAERSGNPPPAWFRPEALWTLAPLAGLGAFFAFMRLTTGDTFAAQHAQTAFISDWSLGNLFDPLLFLRNFFDVSFQLLDPRHSLLDRALFLGFLASLPLVWRRTNPPMFAWCLVMGLTPLLGAFMCYSRHVMLAFPVYIAYASLLSDAGPTALRRAVAYPIVLQAVFLCLHVSNHWVA